MLSVAEQKLQELSMIPEERPDPYLTPIRRDMRIIQEIIDQHSAEVVRDMCPGAPTKHPRLGHLTREMRKRRDAFTPENSDDEDVDRRHLDILKSIDKFMSKPKRRHY